MERSRLGRASVWLNRVTGGKKDQSLCGRWAEARGVDCIACRIIGILSGNKNHCRNELDWFLKETAMKQTSPKLSSLAARILNGYEPTREEIVAMAASLMSQDTTKGQGK